MARTGLLICRRHGRAATRCLFGAHDLTRSAWILRGRTGVGHLGLVASGADHVSSRMIDRLRPVPSPPFPANRRPPIMRVIDPMDGLMH